MSIIAISVAVVVLLKLKELPVIVMFSHKSWVHVLPVVQAVRTVQSVGIADEHVLNVSMDCELQVPFMTPVPNEPIPVTIQAAAGEVTGVQASVVSEQVQPIFDASTIELLCLTEKLLPVMVTSEAQIPLASGPIILLPKSIGANPGMLG